jgi:tRNA A-37 threonylcarbamoyl transferase component Bud32
LVNLAFEPPPEVHEALSRPERVFGDYELLGEIASGGMGVVFRARQVGLNRFVAVKMIRAGQLASAAEVQRFRTEAEATANLDHPHIVPIYEIGEHQGQHYFSMKLIEGENLAESIAKGRFRFPASTAPHRQSALAERQSAIATFMAKVAHAVHHAHQHGVLHRDLKPSNILLDERGEPHLTDFGLAKLVERDRGQTLTDAILGTPSYMSPEQAAGKSKAITTAADIYSLGAILYEMLTGQRLFRGESAQEILQQVLDTEPTRPRLLNSAVSADLETICLKCLEKQPARRYPSAEALAQDLERWLHGKPITARPAGFAVRTWKWMRRHPGSVRLAGLVLLSVLLGAAGIWQWRAIALKKLQRELEEVEGFFREGKPGSALARLALMLRKDPGNRVAAERLLNAFDRHSFLVPHLPAFTNGICHGRWSGDGRHLVLAGTNAQENVVQVYNTNGKLMTELPHGKEAVGAIDVSSDGSMVATGNDRKVRLWHVAQKRPVGDWTMTNGGIRQVTD